MKRQGVPFSGCGTERAVAATPGRRRCDFHSPDCPGCAVDSAGEAPPDPLWRRPTISGSQGFNVAARSAPDPRAAGWIRACAVYRFFGPRRRLGAEVGGWRKSLSTLQLKLQLLGVACGCTMSRELRRGSSEHGSSGRRSVPGVDRFGRGQPYFAYGVVVSRQ